MIVDGHTHVFSQKIIANVSSRSALVKRLRLQTACAQDRTTVRALKDSCLASGIGAGLILPTAAAAEVAAVNAACADLAPPGDLLVSARTLHPAYEGSRDELRRLQEAGVRAIKLCSFSQGFSLQDPETEKLLQAIEDLNSHGERFFVIFDTFYEAHRYFGTPIRNTTTPALLGKIIRKFKGVNFIAAHMGGLAAPAEEIFAHLKPAENLYLDTSNAAHVLAEKDFINLLDCHGPGHIIFGTDWPWFSHETEVAIIEKLLDTGGFGREDKDKVFGGNILGLLGIDDR